MDWKIIAALVVAVAIVVSGFFASGGIGGLGGVPTSASPGGSNPLGDFLEGAKGAISGLLSGIAKEKSINRTLQVSGYFQASNAISLNSPAGFVEIKFNAPASMGVGSEKINFSGNAEASIERFQGRIDVYPNSTFFIDGNAETIYVSNLGILPHNQKAVAIKAAASASSIRIRNASADMIRQNATGQIDMGQGKIALKTEGEPLRIENFFGAVEASGAAFSIDGFSTKVNLEGKRKITVE